VRAVCVLADLDQHRDLLQRAVAGPLADAVDRALDLPRPGQDPGVGVGDRQPQVVVAVDRQLDLAQRRYQLVQAPEVVRILLRRRVADGVGDVDDGRALLDRDRADLGGELDVGPGRVHRRELDVLAVGLGQGDGCPGLSLDVLAIGLQLVLDVDVGGGDEGVDARALSVAHRPPGGVDVGLVGAGEAADHRALDLSRYLLHGLEVAGRGDREAGLDHVDPQPRQLLGDLDLLDGIQRDAGRLLAVPQGGVEYVDAVGVRYGSHGTSSFSASFE